MGSSLIDAGINKILGGDGGGDSGSGDRTGLLVAEAENCPDLFPMVRLFYNYLSSQKYYYNDYLLNYSQILKYEINWFILHKSLLSVS